MEKQDQHYNTTMSWLRCMQALALSPYYVPQLCPLGAQDRVTATPLNWTFSQESNLLILIKTLNYKVKLWPRVVYLISPSWFIRLLERLL